MAEILRADDLTALAITLDGNRTAIANRRDDLGIRHLFEYRDDTMSPILLRFFQLNAAPDGWFSFEEITPHVLERLLVGLAGSKQRQGGAPAKPRVTGDTADYERATEIRRGRGEITTERVAVESPSGRMLGYAKRDRVQSRLAIHARRSEITKHQLMAGERFARTVEGLVVGAKSCLDREMSGTGLHDAMLALGFRAACASRDYQRAVEALGDDLTSIVVWVSVDGKTAKAWAERRKTRDPKRDGMAALRLGLDALVRHYGFDSDGMPRDDEP